ncbi:MAG: molybdopterin-dependent oxidoreductase, partial [Lysobacterales bacterium]
RVTAPQLKKDGSWKAVSWDEALSAAVEALQGAVDKAGPEQLGFLLSPSATTEEYYLAQQLARGLGCGNIDHRLRQQDFSDDKAQPESPAFEARIADIDSRDVILLLGCNPRSEAPIIGHRVRQAWRNGGKVAAINPLDWPFTFDLTRKTVVAPQRLVREVAALAAAVRKVTGRTAPDALRDALDSAQGAESYEALAGQLNDAERGLLLLGQFSASHPDAAWIRALSRYVADATGCALNQLTHGANSVGAWRAGAVPHRGPGGAAVEPGMDAARMLRDPRRAYLLWGIEPEFDIDNPGRAMKALADADSVIAAAAFATESLREIADVILPLAPHAESEGSMVNFDGDAVAFEAAVRPHGEARSGWKILRRLGAELGLPGFDQVGLVDVQKAIGTAIDAGETRPEAAGLETTGTADGLFRIGDVPLYSVDPLCRRATPLQQTAQARNASLGLNPADADRLGLADGARARVRQGDQQAEFEVEVTEAVPEGGAWLRSATCAVRELGPAVGPLSVEVA